jgi:hypothetical protein
MLPRREDLYIRENLIPEIRFSNIEEKSNKSLHCENAANCFQLPKFENPDFVPAAKPLVIAHNNDISYSTTFVIFLACWKMSRSG